jgi:hypothetical protein
MDFGTELMDSNRCNKPTVGMLGQRVKIYIYMVVYFVTVVASTLYRLIMNF